MFAGKKEHPSRRRANTLSQKGLYENEYKRISEMYPPCSRLSGGSPSSRGSTTWSGDTVKTPENKEKMTCIIGLVQVKL
jgi:hypothetical protein